MIRRVARQQKAATGRSQYREYWQGAASIFCASTTPPSAARHLETTS
jgi:hypothetical protein